MTAPATATAPTADALSIDIGRVLNRLRSAAPRVHCLTNAVAQAFTANVLLALGAIPSMTLAAEEVPAFAASADAILVNLGTLDESRRTAFALGLEVAEATGKPWVLDPVFVDRSPPRLALARDLAARRPSLLKVNAGELAALGGAEALAGVPLAVTGPVDLVQVGARTLRLANGHPMMGRVTATGCAAGAVLGACLAVEPDPLLAAAAGLSFVAIAGELAARSAAGPGSFVPLFLDALHALDAASLGQHLRLA
ncbi:hydroxyethylthiazole kinase [Microvirga tunisiensis]|uniref:Hydroxyethylthiazole kinase n=1 Tax=Pannonibacter tanglangensis TaxID=2750084 RepID=A0A7X5EZS5_9HYPH|nr:hydroxyethylthiazole kinase [Pannonibacter sp. XCT-53]NBN77126.1 hydroxyethylthiazole kinase [Pannonibacter sp. XCT-53]